MRLLREPLVHFLLAGAVIFAVYGAVGAPQSNVPQRIVVSSDQIERLGALWRQTRRRLPSQTELKGLVEDFIKEEIYYREALELGLDRNDTVIRRRLRQKMEFLSADAGDRLSPTKADLEAYLAANAERYRIEPTLAFRQVFVNTGRRGAAAGEDARRLLGELASRGADADIADLGDPTLLPRENPLADQSEIARRFGRPFAEALSRVQPGTWAGPLTSGYGLHLVYVRERRKGRVPRLDEVRPAVERDWIAEKRREIEAERFERLRARYQVEIEWPAAARGAARAEP